VEVMVPDVSYRR